MYIQKGKYIMKNETNIILRTNSELKNKVMKICEEYDVSLSTLINACLLDIAVREMIPINIRTRIAVLKGPKQDITIATIKKIIEEVILNSDYKDKIEKVYLFGSFARNEEKPFSDIDLRIKTKRGFSLFDLTQFTDSIKEKTNREVDVVTKAPNDEDKEFFNNVLREEICIYEQ